MAKNAFFLKPTLFQYCLLIAMLLVLPLNIFIGRWAHDYWIGQAETQLLAGLSKDAARERGAVVSTYIGEVKQYLSRVVDGDDAKRALNSPSAAELLSAQLKGRFENQREIRFVPAGLIQEEDYQRGAEFSFSEADMINRAERDQDVWPEASKVDSEWRINFVQGIRDNDAIVGTLFLSISATDMLSTLGKTNLEVGATLLQQKFGQGEPQPVIQLGRGFAGEPQTIDIDNSYWSIQFTPSAILAREANISPLTLFIALSVVALFTLVGGYFAARFSSQLWQQRIDERAAVESVDGDSKTDDLALGSMETMEVEEEDAKLLGMDQKHPESEHEEDPLDIQDIDEGNLGPDLPREIFRAYDIRGLVESQLRSENVLLIGRAIGTKVLASGDSGIVVGRDGRNHSAAISEHLIDGILSTGCNVINIGQVPTPLVYFATHHLDHTSSGVIITASHNPPEYNGFKVVIHGDTLTEEGINALYQLACEQKFASGAGVEENLDLSNDYIDTILNDIALAGAPSIVVDAGNGIGGTLAVRLFEELGCAVTPLYCEVDGNFPNHQPDPSVEENLDALIAEVQRVGADFGVALDGDADRLGVVTSSGKIIRPDRLLMLFAKDIVSRNPGADVIYDVKSSRELNTVISSYGGRPIMWRTGHSPMKAKMKSSHAVLAGELSGHIFIGDRWFGFDDGIYVAARLLEIMCLRDQDLDSIFEKLPNLPATPEIKIPVAEDKKFSIVDRLKTEASFADGRITTIDGLRVDFAKGWGLVRASNTSPALTLRFEAESEEELVKLQKLFKTQLLAIDNDLAVPF